MGIQGAINNIIGSAAIATGAVGKVVKEQKAAKEAEVAEEEAAKEAEQKSIADTEAKLKEANQMALGYSQEELKKREAGEALGLQMPEKNPRGVSNATFQRRLGNLKAMEEIQAKYIQDQEFRKRLEKFTSKDLSKPIKSIITKKGGKL
ncbi:MAG: hypothetical protein IKF82_07455 [Bacilli bacterium]|nr:hypothetical protein [Bacilli bacterium]